MKFSTIFHRDEGGRELERFKEEAAKNPDFLLYAKTKKRVLRYRVAFFVIGLIFLGLSWLIWVKSALWVTTTVKPYVNFLTLLFGLLALGIALFLRYEKEAVRTLYHHTVHYLRHVYKIRQSKALKDPTLPLVDLLRRKIALRGHFVQTKAKLRKLELETFDLMEKIAHQKNLSAAEKETLYDQTLQELKENYEPVVKKYTEQDLF